MKTAFIIALCAVCALCSFAADAPPAEAFRVLGVAGSAAPEITPYVKYQTEMAWAEDDQRRKSWEAIQTEQDLFRVQHQLRTHLLEMIGGLPTEKIPLNAHVGGTIQMNGFHIEKVVFESIPRLYVTALLYVPEDGVKKHPAILVPCGHAADGKAHYQALCQRLARHGYFVICWDPVGQGERSQFWDAKNHKSRYNLICAEHAVMGNLAFLAGTNLARWEIWDGIRAVDYLMTRSDVDPERINITGTSGGGFQTAQIAALDPRIKAAAPSCYITALPMRVYNRIFKDPDSDPEQDLYGMISNGVDHPGLLLMMYPRPVFVAAAVLDFFPIEGTHKTFREVENLYTRFGHADRIALHEGYHEHQYSVENQEAVIQFFDHFNNISIPQGQFSLNELNEKALQCTRTGQIVLDYDNAVSIKDLIRNYFIEHKNQPALNLKGLYYTGLYPHINSWSIVQYDGAISVARKICWQKIASTQWAGFEIDRYVLHHSRELALPLLYIHKEDQRPRPALLWIGEHGKLRAQDWPTAIRYLDAGYDLISIDPRGMGETRMPYKAISPDDPALADTDFDRAYFNPLSSVLADYVYNSLLTGRPYFLQMIEDAEIAVRFAHDILRTKPSIFVTGAGEASALAEAISQTLPDVTLLPQTRIDFKWSDVVDQKRELWPVQYLLPGGAYIH